MQYLKLGNNTEESGEYILTKRFEDMTQAEQRVEICNDALSQIYSKKIKAEAGVYLQLDNIIQDNIKLDDALSQTSCTACALGSLICGLSSKEDVSGNMGWTYDKNDNGNIGLKFHDNEFRINLEKYFSEYDLALIESCFEGDNFGRYGFAEDKEEYEECTWNYVRNHDYVSYYVKFENDEDRLVAILNNIVRNKGTFIPEQDL